MYMKQLFFLFVFSAVTSASLEAQQYDCNFMPPVITIDFGDDRNPKDFMLSQLKDNYRRVDNICPNDGEFTFTSYTKDCYMGNWLSFYKDHTPGSVNGRMMIVNASYTPSAFFSITLTALKPNTQYELSAWLVNVCPGNQGCEPTPPQVRISAFAGGQLISKFHTGPISPSSIPVWRRYAGTFITPASFPGIVVTMEDLTSGGCGNDFAMDDIEIRECKMINPPPPVDPPKVQPDISPKPVTKNNVAKPVIKKEEPKTLEKQVVNKDIAVAEKKPAQKQTIAIKPVTTALPVPEVIKNRENPVVENIKTAPSEILIELYDNGEIDGDSVTIFHNNELVVSHAGLSTKPVTIHLNVDKQNPHHELTMVADNLGSIPPNTSLMVITTKYKRYEVFISSSEKKNAKVVIDLE
jgi:hypothetical protein